MTTPADVGPGERRSRLVPHLVDQALPVTVRSASCARKAKPARIAEEEGGSKPDEPVGAADFDPAQVKDVVARRLSPASPGMRPEACPLNDIPRVSDRAAGYANAFTSPPSARSRSWLDPSISSSSAPVASAVRSGRVRLWVPNDCPSEDLPSPSEADQRPARGVGVVLLSPPFTEMTRKRGGNPRR